MRWAIITLVLTASLAWLALVAPLSNFLPGGKQTGEYLSQLETVLNTEPEPDWHAAEDLIKNIQLSWNRLEPWLELLHEKETVNNFQVILARLTGAIEERNASLSRQDLQELRILWDDLNRL